MMNRCVDCGKFKPWEQLTVDGHTPETDYSAEDMWWICDGCKEKK